MSNKEELRKLFKESIDIMIDKAIKLDDIVKIDTEQDGLTTEQILQLGDVYKEYMTEVNKLLPSIAALAQTYSYYTNYKTTNLLSGLESFKNLRNEQ